jgi:hypothetical protein
MAPRAPPCAGSGRRPRASVSSAGAGGGAGASGSGSGTAIGSGSGSGTAIMIGIGDLGGIVTAGRKRPGLRGGWGAEAGGQEDLHGDPHAEAERMCVVL